jgi:predicted ATP-grasp superfamily ATP-dependent carboligase
MRILITSSRMPYAVGMARKLAEAGHEVYASDAYELAPGSHSKYLAGHFVTGSPRDATERFIDDVVRISSENGIEMIVPSFEEVFYLATQRNRIDGVTGLYAPPFETLARVHDKATFQALTDRLGIRTPKTLVARSDEELREHIGRFPRYFARAAFSRGGVALLTNTGPLAGHVAVEDCHPTPESPWLVQEFVDGPMLCTYTTMHDGRPTAHCTYRAPRQWEHSTAIAFESVDGSETLEIASAIAGDLGYDGQMSLDFVDDGGTLYMIECNPRATDGLLLVDANDLSEAVTQPKRELTMVPPGEEVQLSMAVFGQMFDEGLREWPKSIRDLADIGDAGKGWHDHMPTLYNFLAFAHHAKLEMKERTALFVAMAGDISWDGQPIAGMSDADAALLDELGKSAPA